MAFSDEQLDQMRESLGLPDDADEAAIVEALQAATADTGNADEDEAEGEGGDAGGDPLAALPDGVVAIEAATLAELRAQAARGSDAHARQAREDREALVDAAVRDGRIAPARRAHWLKALEADPGAAATLAALEKGLIAVNGEIGSAEAPESDDLYRRVFGS